MIVAKLGQTTSEPSLDVPRVPSTADLPLPDVPKVMLPGELERVAREKAEAEEEARRTRLRRIMVPASLGVAALGTIVLIVVTREPGSIRRRRSLKPGQVFCKWGKRYRVTTTGRLHRVGNC